MPRSLANGDYSLVMAVESSSRVESWYRVLADQQTGALSDTAFVFSSFCLEHIEAESIRRRQAAAKRPVCLVPGRI